MENEIIKSKGGSQFHHMVPVVLFLCCVPAYSSGTYILLVVLLMLVVVTFIMDKTIQIDTASRKVKNGLFSDWDDLSIGGYISIFNETSLMKIQSRSQSTSLKTKELRLNYIQGRIKKHIYTAKNREDAVKIAILLGDNWDTGVYDAANKHWIKDRTE